MASSRSRRSSARPNPSRPRTKPTEPSVWAPTITLSRIDRPGKRATFWKVRAMPTWAMRWGGTASRSSPAKRTAPDEAV